jgi:hypothetical protein
MRQSELQERRGRGGGGREGGKEGRRKVGRWEEREKEGGRAIINIQVATWMSG